MVHPRNICGNLWSLYIYMFGLLSPNGPHFVHVSFCMHKIVDKKIY
jgi:hypothetical protein